ncbi:MAG: nucleotide exchange factor GrpE [Candidatus Portnoybacteria bacterium]|nr:nucleotide exchange factor GrpE [Candidatus Portnoybacteria bacterium]
MLKKSNSKKVTYISEESEEPKNKIKEFKTKLKECQKEKEGYLTQAQRARADLINYRRRQEQLLEELKIFGQSNLIRELLPVLDSLEIGSQGNKDIGLIKEQLINILKKNGLEEIKAIDEEFNPEFHEAIEQVESKKKQGIIIQEIQKGYLINKKVLKPSKVKVAK